jgi:uncharacterized damage-inducible protein DinB
MIAEILNSFAMTMAFLERLVADVSDEQLTEQPHGVTNHPAWILGHLAVSLQAMGRELGLTAWLPDDWPEQFGIGSQPTSERHAYPSKQDLLENLEEGRRRLAVALSSFNQQRLSDPLPNERYRVLFPTLGHAVTHILGAHAAVHVGQITVWRRAMGLQPLSDPFI